MNQNNQQESSKNQTLDNSPKEINPLPEIKTKAEKPSATTNEIPNFGWSSYAERMNGRFAMIGFLAIILVELLSQKGSFLEWAGLIQ